MYTYNLTNNYPSSATTAATAGIVAGIGTFFLVLLMLAWVVLVVIARWKIFKKAGKDGWKSLIPVYSSYTMLQILNMEPMLCFLTLLPGANFMLSIVMQVKLAKSFKKGTGFAVGLILLQPIFEMILGFGPAKYTQLPSSK
ncbi:signal peptidase I [Candidatus Saccharibacteria bacterium]|nr:signal peptidase I [Candidatus Saccharibacteria bacterium]